MKKLIIVFALIVFISSAAFSQIQVDSIGNVGVGTVSPTTKLDVSGVINATGGNSTEWKQQLTTSGDTIFISSSNYIILPGLSYLTTLIPTLTVQQRLDTAETPLSIFNSGVPLNFLYGSTYEGGLICYLDTITGNGLAAAPFNTSAYWGCSGGAISGAAGTAIGTGAQNTIDIVTGCSGSTAADYCANLSLNGFTDWFLPSKDELNAMYQNLYLNGLGNFGNIYHNFNYWSSTQFDSLFAWLQVFFDGGQFPTNKSSTYEVRAVRAF